jgi:citrate synthase
MITSSPGAALTAGEAATRLKVSRQTLYAYVSRGAIRSEPGPDGRSRLYDAEDIARLIAAKDPRARRDGIAQAALDWGLPVLDSAITAILPEGPCYRGRLAVDLAEDASLESVAGILWAGILGDCAGTDPFDTPARELEPLLSAASGISLAVLARLAPLDRCLILLPLAAPQLPATSTGEPTGDPGELIAAGAGLLRLLVGAVTLRPVGRLRTHEALAEAWRLYRSGADLLRVALVLLADHELNASAFAVRVVASTGAPLHAAVIGGLAALLGPRHGGETARVEAFLDEAAGQHPAEAIIRRLRRGDGGLPGFGHMLYPAGDPRARALLDRLAAIYGADPWFDRLVEAALAATGRHPTVDLALVALTRRLGLPDGSALVLFALGRTVGWIAHALEQRASGRLIRPRARYTGPALGEG